MIMGEDIAAARELVHRNGRICPMPREWDALWKMLPSRQRSGNSWTPALPLILAAWHETSHEQKHQRLLEHLDWAAQSNALDSVVDYLASLPEEKWLHAADTP